MTLKEIHALMLSRADKAANENRARASAYMDCAKLLGDYMEQHSPPPPPEPLPAPLGAFKPED